MSQERPLPVITEQNRGYWAAAARQELVMPHCTQCDRVFFPIAPVCPFCFAADPDWKKVSGRGRVSSFVIFQQAFFAFFKNRLPYAVVQVELDEGPRINANLFDMKPEEVRIGLPVEVTFEKVNDEITLPQFRPLVSGN